MLSLLLIKILPYSSALIYSKDQTGYFQSQLQSVDYYIETGYVSVGNLTISENRLFYSLHLKEGVLRKQDITKDDELIVWIYGGPGCSSQDSNYNENGPIFIDDDLVLHKRETSWNKQAHLIYIDQPFGTGLSYWTYGGYINNSYDAADYVIDLLNQLFQQNQQLGKAKLHIWGESYGGHYIPVLAEKIKKETQFNLIGIGIGGPWSGPTKQITSVVQQLLNFGVIDQYRYKTMMDWGLESLDAIEKEDYERFLEVSDYILEGDEAQSFLGPNFRYNIQIYDYDDGYQYEDFINENKEQFEIPNNITFEGCNQEVYQAFAKDQSESVLSSIDYLLEQNTKVFVYNGQLDTVVCGTGVELWINQLNWKELKNWKKQKKQSWKFFNPKTQQIETAGTIKSYQNFHFAMVYNAGHMTPTDQPEASFEMLKNYFLL